MSKAMRNVVELKDHPDLAAFPLHGEEDFQRLKSNIAEKGEIIKPLDVIGDLVIDGRNRRRALLELGMDACPVLEHDEKTDPVQFALTSAITCRRMTKAAIALTVFLLHPDLSSERKGKVGRPKTGNGDSIPNYRSLAEKYGVDHHYFLMLTEIREKTNDEQWKDVQRQIFDDEKGIGGVNAGISGKIATSGKKRADPKYHLLAPQAATTLAGAFKAWGQINWADHAPQHRKAKETLFTAFKSMPDEIRAINASAITQWPEHERRALARELNKRLRGK